ncbi:MAG: metal-dependent hydrolase [Bdellovibrionia bacterium]
MASAFGHAALSLALGRYRARSARSWKFLILMIVCSILPDFDVIAFSFGIPYGHPLGHRGFSHSILFAALLGVFFSFAFFSRPGERYRFSHEQRVTAVYLFLATLSHGVLDAMTDGGLGVGFFIPFENSRHFFEFRPIHVSPLSIRAFFERDGWTVLKSEFVWVGRIIFALLFTQFILERFRYARRR